MNSNGTEICKLKEVLKFCCEILKAVCSDLIVLVGFLASILTILYLFYPLLLNDLIGIIKEHFSSKYLSIFILSIFSFFILIHLFLRKSKNEQPKTKMIINVAEGSQVQINLLQNTTIDFAGKIDTTHDSIQTPVNGLIDSGKVEILDMANATANPHNEDQE